MQGATSTLQTDTGSSSDNSLNSFQTNFALSQRMTVRVIIAFKTQNI